MKMTVILIAVWWIAACCYGQTITEKMDRYCKAAEATGRMHGYVLVKQNGKVLLSSGYGYSNYTEKTKPTAQTKFQIGSITKQFTATVLLQIADEGKISLNDNLAVYFPGFPKAKQVTIEHLLTHTSGISSYTNDRRIFDSLRQTTVTQQNMLNLIASLPYEFEPGTKWSYSNSAYSLLGYIIEKVTGKTYEQNVRERIFGPLGMQSSGFDFKKAPPLKSTGYYLIQEGNQMQATIIDSSVSFAAGAIYTTPEELATWDAFLVSQFQKKAKWLSNAWTPRQNKYGLGWFADTIHRKPAIHHGGAIDGFEAQNILLPQDSVTITVLLNAEMYNADQIAKDLVGILYDVPVTFPEIPKQIKVNREILQQYTGTYQPDPQMKVVITLQEDKLIFTPDGQPSTQLFPQSETLFFFNIMDAKIEFVKDSSGKVEKFLFLQNGRSMEAKKIQ